jgi:hypothetical protein
MCAPGTRSRECHLNDHQEEPGGLWAPCFQRTLTAAGFIEFLRGLLDDVRGKIPLALDKHPRTSPPRPGASSRTSGSGSKHHLPRYAPDLSPPARHLKGCSATTRCRMTRRSALRSERHGADSY